MDSKTSVGQIKFAVDSGSSSNMANAERSLDLYARVSLRSASLFEAREASAFWRKTSTKEPMVFNNSSVESFGGVTEGGSEP